uniref:Uncharacterized protein n=1 Tax=Glossina austeni TaxID=7395 RepID=A0A1A9VXD1_GLOAU
MVGEFVPLDNLELLDRSVWNQLTKRYYANKPSMVAAFDLYIKHVTKNVSREQIMLTEYRRVTTHIKATASVTTPNLPKHIKDKLQEVTIYANCEISYTPNQRRQPLGNLMQPPDMDLRLLCHRISYKILANATCQLVVGSVNS